MNKLNYDIKFIQELTHLLIYKNNVYKFKINHKQQYLYIKNTKLRNTCYNTAKFYKNKNNIKDAIILFKRSAKLGNVNAIIELAEIIDITDSIELLEKAIEYGNIKSMNIISELYKLKLYEPNKYEIIYNIFKKSCPIKKNFDNLPKPIKLTTVYGCYNKDICLICYDTLMNTNMSIIIRNCGHIFHYECFKKYNEKCIFKCD